MKYILYATDTLVLILLVSTIFLGKLSTHSKEVIRQHKILARTLLVTIFASVVVIETMVRLNDGTAAWDILFLAHLWCAGMFLIGIILLNWLMSGERSRHHALVAYLTLFLGLATVATAFPIIARL